MTYADKLRDPRWQKKRLEVMQRDGFRCRDCGDTSNTLHVHHCFYEKGGPWDTPSGLLMTLCEPCHKARGDLENRAARALALIMASMGNKPDDFELKQFVAGVEHVQGDEDAVAGMIDMNMLWEIDRRLSKAQSKLRGLG